MWIDVVPRRSTFASFDSPFSEDNMITINGRGIKEAVLNYGPVGRKLRLRVDDKRNPELWFEVDLELFDLVEMLAMLRKTHETGAVGVDFFDADTVEVEKVPDPPEIPPLPEN